MSILTLLVSLVRFARRVISVGVVVSVNRAAGCRSCYGGEKMKKILVVSLCVIALFVVGCSPVGVMRDRFCFEKGFDNWKFEHENTKDLDIICFNEQTNIPNSDLIINYTEQWHSDYDFQVWRSNYEVLK